jgi:hypothetical protein
MMGCKHGIDGACTLCADATTIKELRVEIERLRMLLARYRDETPLGHQPHMIAHLVDKALGRGE